MKGDAKICFEALAKEEEPTNRSISLIIRNAFDLNLSFFSCEFCWVKRSLNSAAHSAAKHVVDLRVGFSCNKCNFPPSILEACGQDCCTAFFFYLVFNEMAVYHPKKKKKNPSLVSASILPSNCQLLKETRKKDITFSYNNFSIIIQKPITK